MDGPPAAKPALDSAPLELFGRAGHCRRAQARDLHHRTQGSLLTSLFRADDGAILVGARAMAAVLFDYLAQGK